MKPRLISTSVMLSIGLLFMGPLLGQEGDDSLRKKALELNKITGDTAITAKIRELYKDKPALRKLLAEASALSKEKEKDPPFNYTAAFILARCAHVMKDYDAGEMFYKQCVEHAFKLRSTQKLSQVFDGLIDLFERAKKYDDAIFICQKYIDLGGEDGGDESIERVKPFVIERMIEILTRAKKFDKAMEMVEKMVKADEGGWYFLRRKAEVLREQGKAEESLADYKEVLERLKKSKLQEEEQERYVMVCKYTMSGLHVDLGQIDKGVELLEELLKDKPDSSTFNNDLGYVLADHNLRLDDAEKFIKKALELDRAERKKHSDDEPIATEDDKDNSAYLDSLAWVYFRQKKFAEARDIMLEVVKSDDSQHVEIYDHLAEIYHALGQREAAMKAWQKAITLDNVSYRDDARKIAVKKKIEANK